MQLPFTPEQFFSVFRAYNDAVWPVQLALLGLAVTAVACIFVAPKAADAAVSAILSFFWLWLGFVYHLTYFAMINPVAYVFGAVSLAGAVVFAWQGVVTGQLRFVARSEPRVYAGAGLILFALVVYPLLSSYAGHPYPDMPTFGLPCPTAIFTIGVLAFLERPYPRLPFIVPVLWSFVGLQAAFLLGVPQDAALLPAGAFGLWLAIRNG